VTFGERGSIVNEMAPIASVQSRVTVFQNSTQALDHILRVRLAVRVEPSLHKVNRATIFFLS
jgi:hypothetical protein